jgi:hypothetical protein
MYLCVTAPLLVSKDFQAKNDATMIKSGIENDKKNFGIANI